MPRKPTGVLLDPEFRRERARKAGQASHTTDHYIARPFKRVPEFTEAQRAEVTRLAELAALTELPPVDGGE